MNDKQFLADAEKARLDVSPLSGAKVQDLVQKLYATPQGRDHPGAAGDHALTCGCGKPRGRRRRSLPSSPSRALTRFTGHSRSITGKTARENAIATGPGPVVCCLPEQVAHRRDGSRRPLMRAVLTP